MAARARPATRCDRAPKVLHLAPDTQFIPFVQRVFEAAFPGCNRFRIVSGAHAPGLTFVRPSEALKIVRTRYWFSSDLADDLRWCQCLVLHFMIPWFGRAIAVAPPRVTVVWSAWGGDFYHLIPEVARALYLPETRRIMARLPRLRTRNPFALLRRAVDAALPALLLPRWERDLVERIDVVSMLPGEHRLLAASMPHLRARYHHLVYGSAEDVFARGPDRVHGSDILVGNSATATGNHADAFSLLSRFDLGERRIVVPLGYGDEAYADEICRVGARLFGSRFRPLRGYLPLEAFNQAISACSVVLMNHVRQQAIRTINTALYKGAKVLLRPENPVLPYFRELGLSVFELTEASQVDDRLFEPLGEEHVRSNRRILASSYSFESAVERARGLAAIVAEHEQATASA
jgi:hypothetical protein